MVFHDGFGTGCGPLFVDGRRYLVYAKRDALVGLRMTNDPPFLRHFTARFEEMGTG